MADTAFADLIANVATAMRAHGVRHFSNGVLTLELFAAESQPLPAEPPATPDEDVCACGHSLEIEHNESGCLMGCSHETCAAKAGAP